MSWSQRQILRAIFVCVAASLTTESCLAWSESGHRLIASIAFQQIPEQRRSELLVLLKGHPRYDVDFQVPSNLRAEGRDKWLFQRAAVWPDLVVNTPYDRPMWHRQPSSLQEVGTVSSLPLSFEREPGDATLSSLELPLSQALTVCRRVLNDEKEVAAERAIALCWVMQLVGEAHQPCNAGSLYAEGLFPEGDNFGTRIPIERGTNLHAVWDALLGENEDDATIFHLGEELRRDRETWERATKNARTKRGLEVSCWLVESWGLGPTVYDDEIIRLIEDASKSGGKLMPVVLSERYLERVRAVAKKRAIYAAMRLAAIVSDVE